MRNHYFVSQDMYFKFGPIILDFISAIRTSGEDGVEPVDLTHSGINPYQVGEILKFFGYERGEYDTNGWEMDFWCVYRHNTLPTVVVAATGITFELSLNMSEEE